MELGRAISSNSLVLGLFALLTTAAIATTYLNTRDAIAAQERAAKAKALLQIVPTERHDNSMLDDTLPINQPAALGLQEPGRMFVARKAGKVVALIIPSTAPDGYSGAIRLLTGVNRDGSVAGVRVVAHGETPGLGDKVELKKSDWVLGFNDKSLTNPKPPGWKVKKDKGEFDQFTGATITPRAVTQAVYQTLVYYQDNKNALLKEAEPTATEDEDNG
jgi:electron transport complex protein RnfG